MRIKEETSALVPCIAFICQEVLDFDMAGTCMSTPDDRGSNNTAMEGYKT